jgi:predicted phosphodiesterase
MDFDARTRMFSRQPVKVGIVADTYDNRDGLRQLLDRFLVGGARWLFHCGGLGSAGLVDQLKPQIYIVAGEKDTIARQLKWRCRRRACSPPCPHR